LTKAPNKRLCNYDKITTNPFYRNFSFDELINLNLPPAHVPKLKPEHPAKPIPFNKYLLKVKDKLDTVEHDPIAREDQVLFDKWFENFK
jgi:hypothetical protein